VIADDTLNDRLASYRQIKSSVIGRKSGNTISIPVWFVLEGEKLYLLPVQGSDLRLRHGAACQRHTDSLTPGLVKHIVCARRFSQ
jgi:hypothetical protein